MPPTRPDRQRPTAKAQPPRPPNAWILYRSDKLRELAQTAPPGPRRPQAEISKIISQMWSAEGPDTKGMYEARAEEKKAEHAALYPDYKFAPMKKEDKAMLRRAQRQEKEELRAAERSRNKKRKGKGREDEEEEPYALPYPLARPQSWYPPSTYGPRQEFAASGWTAPVDPQGDPQGNPQDQQDAPFRADAYQSEYQEPHDADEWTGEEGEWGAEEAWAGRSRRGAVWDEEQVADQEAWRASPPAEQSRSLTITLPATIGPSEQPYTFNLDFDMPMATFAGDPDANVALSLNNMNLSEPTNPNGLLGDLNVPGLNDLLTAPLPDINITFPDFNSPEGHSQFDVLSNENEEWWAALMDAALMSDDQQGEQGEQRYDPQPGPSHAGPSHAGPSHAASHTSHASHAPQPAEQPSAGPSTRPLRPTPVHTQSLPTFSHGLPSPDGDGSRSRATSSATYPGHIPGAFPTEEPSYRDDSYQDYTYPQPSYSYPEEPYVHPSPFAQIASSRSAGLRAPAPWRPPAPAPQQRPRANTRGTFPAPNNAGFPSPAGARGFPSPSGAAPFPSPSGAPMQPRGFPATPQTTIASPHPPRPPPPLPQFFNTRRGKDEDKGKEKDPEAFDFSGWGNQYAAQPPTPAEDAVRRGVGVSH